MARSRNLPSPELHSIRDILDPAKGTALRGVLDRISSKWAVLVLLALAAGTMRFNTIRRSIPDVSNRMLTLTLRHLAEDGLILRVHRPTMPPTVEYSLTRLGRSLVGSLGELLSWAEQNHQAVLAARDAYSPPPVATAAPDPDWAI